MKRKIQHDAVNNQEDEDGCVYKWLSFQRSTKQKGSIDKQPKMISPALSLSYNSGKKEKRGA
jgi:hypothetical protein